MIGRLIVIIDIRAEERAPLRVNPDPASVIVGEDIMWDLFYEGYFPDSIQWVIYFDSGNPFNAQRDFSIKMDTSATTPGGTLVGGAASNEGDFKYGVRLLNAKTSELLSDDDPRIIVTTKPT
jgi:hypothetical protein